MKLIALVIKQYDKLFKNQIFNFSDEYKVDFNFETNELKIGYFSRRQRFTLEVG